MMFLVGWHFLMSEVPLQSGCERTVAGKLADSREKNLLKSRILVQGIIYQKQIWTHPGTDVSRFIFLSEIG
jgi:hypothetical protein